MSKKKLFRRMTALTVCGAMALHGLVMSASALIPPLLTDPDHIHEVNDFGYTYQEGDEKGYWRLCDQVELCSSKKDTINYTSESFEKEITYKLHAEYQNTCSVSNYNLSLNTNVKWDTAKFKNIPMGDSSYTVNCEFTKPAEKIRPGELFKVGYKMSARGSSEIYPDDILRVTFDCVPLYGDDFLDQYYDRDTDRFIPGEMVDDIKHDDDMIDPFEDWDRDCFMGPNLRKTDQPVDVLTVGKNVGSFNTRDGIAWQTAKAGKSGKNGTPTMMYIVCEYYVSYNTVRFQDMNRIAYMYMWCKEDEPAPSKNKGDVNGDDKTDIEDAVNVISHVNGQKALTDEEYKRADVDGNSKVDIEDAVAIISHVNGVKALK